MLIPSIDLKGGRVVQLEQGEREVLATDDLDGWIAKFSACDLVQVIDLDAALGSGTNAGLVHYVCQRLPCQVGGGIRTPAHAQQLLDAGARRVILGSVLFDADCVAVSRAREFHDTIGADALVGAVDSRGGRVVIHGWRTRLNLDAVEAVRVLSPFVGALLATLVDGEGLMRGLDIQAVEALRAATDRRLIVAGGVRHMADVRQLDALGVDVVVGMAIYTGQIGINARNMP